MSNSSSNFDMNQYAPTNPLEEAIPGFGFPGIHQLQGQQQRVPSQSQATSSAAQMAVPVQRSQSTSNHHPQLQQAGSRTARAESEISRTDTAGMRRALSQAAPYIPTPINNSGAGQGQSPAPSRAPGLQQQHQLPPDQQRHLQQQFHQQQFQQQQHQIELFRLQNPNGTAHPPPMLPNQQARPQVQPSQDLAIRHANQQQGQPPRQNEPTQEQLQQINMEFMRLVLNLSVQEILRMHTYITYLDHPFFVRFKNVLVTRPYLVCIMLQYNLPICENLRRCLPPDHPMMQRALEIGNQYPSSERVAAVHEAHKREFLQKRTEQSIRHVQMAGRPQDQRPAPPMQPNQMPPNRMQPNQMQRNQMMMVPPGFPQFMPNQPPPPHFISGQQGPFMAPMGFVNQQVTSIDVRMQHTQYSSFPQQQGMPPQMPNVMQPPPQQFAQPAPPRPQTQSNNLFEQQPPQNQESMHRMLSSDEDPPFSAMTPAPAQFHHIENDVPEDPVERKPDVQKLQRPVRQEPVDQEPAQQEPIQQEPVQQEPVQQEAAAQQVQEQREPEPESEILQKPVVRRLDNPIIPNPVQPAEPQPTPQTPKRPIQKKPKKPIVITLDDDGEEVRPRVKQEVVDEEVSSSSSNVPQVSVKQEPGTNTSGPSTSGLRGSRQEKLYSQREVEQLIQAALGQKSEESKQLLEKVDRLENVVNTFIKGNDAPGAVQKVQEPQVTTSRDADASASASAPKARSPSPEYIRRTQRRKIVLSEEEDEGEEAQVPSPAPVSSTPSASERRKSRPMRPLIEDSDDDEMPMTKKRRRRVVDSEERDYEEEEEEEEDETASNVSASTVSPSSSGDSMEDFIVNDDFEEERDTRKKGGSGNRKRTPKGEVSSGRSSRASKEKSDTPKRRKRAAPNAEPGEPVKKDLTEEEKAALKKCNPQPRKPSWRTREDNREKARMMGLEEMNHISIGRPRTRACESTMEGPSSPITQKETAQPSQPEKKREKHQEQPDKHREHLEKRRDQSEKRRDQPSSSTSSSQQRSHNGPGSVSSQKRTSTTERSSHEDDGVHIPSKRMAHSNSIPGTSKARPQNPAHRQRLSQLEVMNRSLDEKARRDKQLDEEIVALQNKKHRTAGEEQKLAELRRAKARATGAASGSASAQIQKTAIKPSISKPSTSTSSITSRPSTSAPKLIRVKQEFIPVELPKPKPPALLEPARGIAYRDLRLFNIKRIFEILLETSSCSNPETKAQEIELQLVTDFPSQQTYRMKSMHKITELKKKCTSGVVVVNQNAVSHTQNINGVAKENCTILKGKEKLDYQKLSIEDLAVHLKPLKLTRAELYTNAYPLFKPNSNLVEIAQTQYTQNKKTFVKNHDSKRTCSRCFKDFHVNLNGSVVREEDICRYHNRAVTRDGKRDTATKRYECCNEDVNGSSPGCKWSDVHVFDELFERELGKFVSTPPPTSKEDPRSKMVYALDCEMVYTVEGPALARLSMVNMQQKTVLEVSVKPPTEVIDPNTDFSGLTMEDVNTATDTLASCHRKLFELVNSETILIGHSLESDLKAMRVSHTSVIDTSVMYPSTTNMKRSLKVLSAKYLGKKIQSDNEDAVGHDSLEDANTCVQLVFFGLKNPETVAQRPSSSTS